MEFQFQDATTDSLQVAPQSQDADSSPADSLNGTEAIVDELSRDLTETGELLVAGNWEEVITRFYEGITTIVVEFIPRLLSAMIVLLIFLILNRALKKFIANILRRSKQVDKGLEGLLLKTYSGIVWVFISIMVLAQFGINVTALLAGLSVVGVAVGFAAQDTIQNFISGITILIDRPFKVGHYIEIDGTYGKVKEITLRSTRLQTLNNEMMVMPNSQMINQKLLNYTQHGVLRIEVPFGIAYKESPEDARRIVLELTENDERLHPNRKPEVVVSELGASSVDMQLRLFIPNAADAVSIRSEYMERVFNALKEANIEIPFPHLQLFIDEAKALENISLKSN